MILSYQHNVDYRTRPTVTSINLWGTWNLPHHALYELKVSNATLAIHCFVEALVSATLGLLRP